MFLFRWVWCLVAIATAALSLWLLSSVTLSDGGLGSCSAMGSFNDARPDVQCADLISHAFGVRPLVWIGLLVVAPSAVAAVVPRWWVSWVAVVAFAALSVYGLAHMMGIQSLLVAAIPLAVISFVVAVAHTVVRFVNGSTRAHGIVLPRDGRLGERTVAP